MAKFYGEIGYSMTIETSSGIWEEKIEKKNYYGDVVRNSRSWQNSSNVNDDLEISNQISIIADSFALKNFGSMRYVEFMDTLWKIKSIDIEYPRLLLTIGGVYNGPQT